MKRFIKLFFSLIILTLYVLSKSIRFTGLKNNKISATATMNRSLFTLIIKKDNTGSISFIEERMAYLKTPEFQLMNVQKFHLTEKGDKYNFFLTTKTGEIEYI